LILFIIIKPSQPEGGYMQNKHTAEKIIGCAYKVYNTMGFGFLEMNRLSDCRDEDAAQPPTERARMPRLVEGPARSSKRHREWSANQQEQPGTRVLCDPRP
jgi:hypothetical protein